MSEAYNSFMSLFDDGFVGENTSPSYPSEEIENTFDGSVNRSVYLVCDSNWLEMGEEFVQDGEFTSIHDAMRYISSRKPEKDEIFVICTETWEPVAFVCGGVKFTVGL